MFNITKDGTIIATVDKLAFWKRQRNGMNILCAEGECNGIVVDDTFCHLPWRPQSGGGEQDASYEEFSGAETIAELDNALLDAAYDNIIGGMDE